MGTVKLGADIKFRGYNKEEITINKFSMFTRQHLEHFVCYEFSRCVKVSSDFFSVNYTKGGVIPIKEVRNHPEWKPEYEKLVQVKRVHMCKSCKSKAQKGCCPLYSPKNRVMIKVIVGWSR